MCKVTSRLAWAYVIFFIAWQLLRLIFFDRLWWVALINMCTLYLFLPLIFLFPLALGCRLWKAAIGLCLPLGVCLALYTPFFLPNFITASSSQPSINLMTFNMLFHNYDYDAVAKIIEKNAPDIIGMQEIPISTPPQLIEKLTPNYPYQAFHPIKTVHKVGIFSKFPLENINFLADSPLERGLEVTAKLQNGKKLRIFVTHLTPNHPPQEFLTLAKSWFQRRNSETSYLRQKIKNQSVPTVMLCDCNFVETSQAYVTINDVMIDSYRQVGWGLGHTMRGQFFPVGRIDYIWHTNQLQSIDAQVETGGNSDHFAVVSRLNWLSD